MTQLKARTIETISVPRNSEKETILREKMSRIVFYLLIYRRIRGQNRKKMIYLHAILRHLADEGRVTQGHIKGDLILTQGIIAFSKELFSQAWTSVQALVGNELMGEIHP